MSKDPKIRRTRTSLTFVPLNVLSLPTNLTFQTLCGSRSASGPSEGIRATICSNTVLPPPPTVADAPPPPLPRPPSLLDLDVPFGRAPVEDAAGAAAEAAPAAAVGGFLTEILRGRRLFSLEYLVQIGTYQGGLTIRSAPVN